jgi:hypothetical protein
MIGPEPFALGLEGTLDFDNKIIGIQGKIAEKGHQYDGYWCLACLRMRGEVNLGNKPGQYLIWIARNEPRFSPGADKAIYEWVDLDKSTPCLCGYGTIADSSDRIRKDVEMALNSRKSIKAQYQKQPEQ